MFYVYTVLCANSQCQLVLEIFWTRLKLIVLNYVIATAPDFTGKKWKALRKGNELLLTTQGGTVLILK